MAELTSGKAADREGAGNGQSVVKSADRALAILELLSTGPRRMTDIAEQLALPLSSVHGLLATLVHRGFAEFDAVSRTYGLGLKAWTVGQGYQGHRDIAGVALPLMEQLAQDTGETVQLAKLDGLDNVYIAIAESPQPMKLVSAVGMRLPAYATGIGKALLAGLPEKELARRLRSVSLRRFTEHTIGEVSGLVAELAGVRRDGYATDDQEYVIGCRCVAVAVRDGAGDVVAAMSVSAPTPRCGPHWTVETHARLAETVAALEGRLRH
jgi:DNA-binding IclR family transcriptional regulator